MNQKALVLQNRFNTNYRNKEFDGEMEQTFSPLLESRRSVEGEGGGGGGGLGLGGLLTQDNIKLIHQDSRFSVSPSHDVLHDTWRSTGSGSSNNGEWRSSSSSTGGDLEFWGAACKDIWGGVGGGKASLLCKDIWQDQASARARQESGRTSGSCGSCGSCISCSSFTDSQDYLGSIMQEGLRKWGDSPDLAGTGTSTEHPAQQPTLSTELDKSSSEIWEHFAGTWEKEVNKNRVSQFSPQLSSKSKQHHNNAWGTANLDQQPYSTTWATNTDPQQQQQLIGKTDYWQHQQQIQQLQSEQVVNQWQQLHSDPGSNQQHSDTVSNNVSNILKQQQHLLEVGGSLHQDGHGFNMPAMTNHIMTRDGTSMNPMTNNGLYGMTNNCMTDMTPNGMTTDGWAGVTNMTGMTRDDKGPVNIDDDVFNKHFFNNRILSVDDIQQLMQNGRTPLLQQQQGMLSDKLPATMPSDKLPAAMLSDKLPAAIFNPSQGSSKLLDKLCLQQDKAMMLEWPQDTASSTGATSNTGLHNQQHLLPFMNPYSKQLQDQVSEEESGFGHYHQNLGLAMAARSEAIATAGNASLATGVATGNVLEKTATTANMSNTDQSLTLMNLMKLIELEEKNATTLPPTTLAVGTGGLSPAIATMPPKLDPTMILQTNGRPITGGGKSSNTGPSNLPAVAPPSTALPPPQLTSFLPPPFPPPMNLRLPPPATPTAVTAGASSEQRFFPPTLPVHFKVPPPSHPPAVPPPSFSVPPPGMGNCAPPPPIYGQPSNTAASSTGGYGSAGGYSMPRSRLALELHLRLEQAYDQFRCLEKERKKSEAGLARLFPGRKISSANNIPIPKLPFNPTRVDKLVIDNQREFARITTLLVRMEKLRDGVCFEPGLMDLLEQWRTSFLLVQEKREEELSGTVGRDRDSKQLINVLGQLGKGTRAARTGLWCAMQATAQLESTGAKPIALGLEKPKDLDVLELLRDGENKREDSGYSKTGSIITKTGLSCTTVKPKITTSQTTTTKSKKEINDYTNNDENNQVRAIMKKVIEELAVDKSAAGTTACTASKKNSSKQNTSTAILSDNKKKLLVGLRQTAGKKKKGGDEIIDTKAENSGTSDSEDVGSD